VLVLLQVLIWELKGVCIVGEVPGRQVAGVELEEKQSAVLEEEGDFGVVLADRSHEVVGRRLH